MVPLTIYLIFFFTKKLPKIRLLCPNASSLQTLIYKIMLLLNDFDVIKK